MKCQAFIDPETKIALEGEALIAAAKNPDAPRCGCELESGDSFCPSCGACVEVSSAGMSESNTLKNTRATRAAFWGSVALFLLTNILFFVLAGENFNVMDGSLGRGIFLKVLGYVNLFAYAYCIKTSVRRLHDIERSGWWIVPCVCLMVASTIATFISAITESNSFAFSFLNKAAVIVNLGMVVWLGFAKGTKGPNKYGPDPLANETARCDLGTETAKEGEVSVGTSKNVPKCDAEDKSRSSCATHVEQPSKPGTKSRSFWIVFIIGCGIGLFVIEYYSRQSMKRANDMFFRTSHFADDNLLRIMNRANTEQEKGLRTLLANRERRAAEEQFNKGMCYYNGDGAEQDKKEAVQWFRKAAEQGFAEAQFYLV